MKAKFYKLRRNRVIWGVLSGLADIFNFDLGLLRFYSSSLQFPILA